MLLIEEMLIGAMLGVTARLTISALEVAGLVIAQQLGLGFVTAIDPTQGEQGVMVGNFLTILGITLFFATDMHHLVIAALNDSYNLFEPGDMPTTGDAAALITKTVAGAFRIGIQLSAPFIVFGFIFNIGLGVLARLMPQMQVFFVALPLSIMLGLLFLLLLLGAMMGFFPRLCRRRAARDDAARIAHLMADENSEANERTEDPTPKRLEDAMRRGDVVRSIEVNTWFMIAGGTLMIMMFGSSAATSLQAMFRGLLAKSYQIPTDGPALIMLVKAIAMGLVAALGIPLVLLLVAAFAGNLVQHRLRFTTDR